MRIFRVLVILTLCSTAIVAGDWPTYRADAGRSGYTSEQLPASLSLQWIYKHRHAPQPAWQGADTRMRFDYAYHTVVADGSLFFGSSADGQIHALDAVSGRPRWCFFTGGPVRFAPVIWKDRLFAVSDDGHLYCLRAADGQLVWKKRGGPGDGMVLGNGHMISRWPARGGPVIVDDVVYFAAGIWPTEGIFIYALDAETGRELWTNHDSGTIEMPQPHPTAEANSGLAAQGYLVANRDRLFVPTGRAVPAALDRSDGRFLYFHLQANGHRGGAFITTDDHYLFNGNAIFDPADGSAITAGIPTSAVVLSPGHIIYATGQEIRGIDRNNLFQDTEVIDRLGNKVAKKVVNTPAWSIKASCPVETPLIVVGQTVIAGGKTNNTCTVMAFDIPSKSPLWSHEVEGTVHGLAVADGRLYVSTDKGYIYCYGEDAPSAPTTITADLDKHPYADNKSYIQAVEEIIRLSRVTDGYCLDLACGSGELAYELARRTNLRIIAIDADAENVGRARTRLNAAGLYGSRVTVFQGDPTATTFAPYFADLVVSGRSVGQGADGVSRDEYLRLQRPFGGVVCLGRPGEMTVSVREGLPGASVWTHQYCDPANTACSADTLVAGPLGMLWWTDNDFTMPSRHGRGPAPLVWEGRLFVEGMDGLRAIDAYNGRVLWEYPLPGILKHYDQEHLNGAAITGSNFCLADGILYVAVEDRCFLIDAKTGREINEFPAPARPDGGRGQWGYIACENGTLFGSLFNEEHTVTWAFMKSDMSRIFSESILLFALDAATGRLKWKHAPRYSIRNNTIAVAQRRVFLIDRPLTPEDRLRPEEYQTWRQAAASQPEAERPPPAVLIALNADTGGVLWQKEQDVFGTLLAVSAKHDVLLMTSQNTRFRLHSEHGRQMRAYRASTGDDLWDALVERPARYPSAARPIINDQTIYFEPFAYDLLTGTRKTLDTQTGESEPWQFSRSYGCGIIAGSRNLLVFRSATFGYLDLLRGGPTQNYGGIRPGCWINAIPAGGLVLLPDATARCVCSYLNKATIALYPLDHDYANR